MGAHWKTAMRKKGFNPKMVVDAPARLGVVEAVVGLQDMKGAVIGDPENCSGNRCLRRKFELLFQEKEIRGELFLFLGASTAIVAWRNGRGKQQGYRFLVNGLPKAQDRTMSVVGETIALRPPHGTHRASGKRRGSKPEVTRGQATGRNSAVQSLAAQLRSS